MAMELFVVRPLSWFNVDIGFLGAPAGDLGDRRLDGGDERARAISR